MTDNNGHGSHVAGTLAGMPYGKELTETVANYAGMAPDAKLAIIGASLIYPPAVPARCMQDAAVPES